MTAITATTTRRFLLVPLALALVPMLVLMLAGCVRQQRFRYVYQQNECFVPQPDPLPGDPTEHRPYPSLDCRSTLYKVGFIEFNEDGTHIDPVQAHKVIALIEREKARVTGHKVITLVYVHGWKNNGDQARPGAEPKDVERFSRALTELGMRAEQASPGNPVPIIGVYIGWRGKSLMGPGWFTWLSYWGRRNTANHIGSEPLATVLNTIIDTTTPNAADKSRVLFVGHSFGARVLEHAIENGVKLYDPETLKHAVPVRPRVDLVLYVNAANDARLSTGRLQKLQAAPITVRHPDYEPQKCATAGTHDPVCKEYPLLVAITSRGDLATKFLQPTANRINLDKNGAPDPQPVTGSFVDPTPSIGRLRRSAPGHLPFMHSHVVTEIVCPIAPGERVACPANDETCAFAFRTQGDCDACFKANVRAKVVTQAGTKTPFNQTAYWIMDVDTRVVKDHGDIWNLSMLNMLGELMAPRGFFQPEKGPMQIRATN
jgi:hypothetical protein